MVDEYISVYLPCISFFIGVKVILHAFGGIALDLKNGNGWTALG